MLKKAYKVIEKENSKLSIYGNGQYREIDYKKPEWIDEEEEVEACFDYKGNTYFLSEFMRVDGFSSKIEDFEGFDGYRGDSFFSGLLIKLSDCGDCVKVYTYISH